ncbi:MAG: GAF domain-containing protein [Gemmatirosa sp.]
MNVPSEHPPFGSADLSNCERELIHLAGSIQPHGALLVVREADLVMVQLSVNTRELLGIAPDELLGRPLAMLGAEFARQVAALTQSTILAFPSPLRCELAAGPAGVPRRFDVLVSRSPGAGIVIELELHEPAVHEPAYAGPATAGAGLSRTLTAIIADIGSALTMETLCDAVVQHFRALAGYDRVMVYKFDPDGHGEVVAEARDERFEPFLGLHYPASDIPQRARELYLRNRVRVLADVRYVPVPIEPRVSPLSGQELDMSLCHLRSMSPLHLQYLQNMGVTGTLVASLIKEGQLWGLIACHHYTPKLVGYELRAACELLAEVISTRISALENYAQAHAELLVRKLERRLIDATATTGDWRLALFNQPQPLLTAVQATGVALLHDGELLTAGETPTPDELRTLCSWLAANAQESVFQTPSLARADRTLAPLAPLASGVLAVMLSRTEQEYLLWFRKEQPCSVTWAGDPKKPFTIGNDPRDLSPRRSFAAWRELVSETARPWTPSDIAIAGAIRSSLVDLISQIRSVRVLIAERQAARVRGTVDHAGEPVVIAAADGEIILSNQAFHALFRRPKGHVATLDDLPALFAEPERVRAVLTELRERCRPWRGELTLAGARSPGGSGWEGAQLALRADAVPTSQGDILGYVLIFTDRSERREAEATRLRLQHGVHDAHAVPFGATVEYDGLVAAILGNASAAVDEITESTTDASIGTLLREVESAARRAAVLSEQILSYASPAAARPAPPLGTPPSVSSSSAPA